MNAKTICILVCLTGCSLPAHAGRTTQAPAITKGSITFPSKDIVFHGPMTSSLGPLGGFQIGVKLPQHDISASECGQYHVLAVQMGDVQPLDTDLNTPKYPALAKKKQQYYATLKTLSHEKKMITLAIQGKREFLVYHGKKLYAPYCIVAFSRFDK